MDDLQYTHIYINMYSSLEIIYIYIYLILTFKESLMKGQQFFWQKIAILVGAKRNQPDPRFRDRTISICVDSVLPFDLTLWLKLNVQKYSPY